MKRLSRLSAFFVWSGYQLALFLFLLALVPKIIWAQAKKGKYKKNLRLRLIGTAPCPTKKLVIWFHAVSVGEVKALVPLFHLYQRQVPDAFFAISTVTETGFDVAKSELPLADAHCYLPLDLPWAARRFVKQLQPNVCILIEGDYWFNLLREAKRAGATLFVASGKLSQKSLRRYAKIPFFSSALFHLIDHFCMQSEEHAARLHALKVPQTQLTVAGNLKLDRAPTHLTASKKKELAQQLGIQQHEKVIVIGSTHEKEEEKLLSLLAPLLAKEPHLKLLFLPRHPDRFRHVKALLADQPYSYALFSAKCPLFTARLVLVDQMGLLPLCYQIAYLALVGGSFVPGVGGHDIFEPARLGIPVLFGPYMETQVELTRLILDAGAGKQVRLDQLQIAVEKLLLDQKKRQTMSYQGLCLGAKVGGVAVRHWNAFAKKSLCC